MIDSSNKSSHVDISDEKNLSNENLSKLKEVDSSDDNDSVHVQKKKGSKNDKAHKDLPGK